MVASLSDFADSLGISNLETDAVRGYDEVVVAGTGKEFIVVCSGPVWNDEAVGEFC